MLFFPYKADIKLSRFPVLTILITIICLFVYWQQVKSENAVITYAENFCEQQKSKIHRVIMKNIAQANNVSEQGVCAEVFVALSSARNKNETIANIVATTTKFSTKSLDKTHVYIRDYLNKQHILFADNAPKNLTNSLVYDPQSFNVFKMITSAFSHGSWMHVIGNLFFFFAFATTIEAIVGVALFPLIIFALAIGTNLAYSLAVMSSPESVPTLGLSGVVMGVMGLFTYFIPRAYIRCFFWFLIIVRRFSIPAWILALWYVGWDTYELYQTGNSGGVNLIAHVSGFVEGFLIGMLLFKKRKAAVHDEIQRSESSKQFNRAMGL